VPSLNGKLQAIALELSAANPWLEVGEHESLGIFEHSEGVLRDAGVGEKI
jgi:hypothetical protein